MRGETVRLTARDDVVAVNFAEPALYEARRRSVDRAELGSFSKRYEVPGEKITLFSTRSRATAGRTDAIRALDALSRQEDVTRVSPVYELGALAVVPTDRIVVRAKPGQAGQLETLGDLGLTVVDRSDGMVVLRAHGDVDVVQLARQIADYPWVLYAEPDLATIGERPRRGMAMAEAFSITAEGTQPALQLIGADQALERQPGAADVRIAVLDDGGDVLHPDLKDALVGYYDAITNSTLEGFNAWDGHGTACAGLIAARPGNGRMRGACAGASLLLVRIASSPQPGGRWTTSSSAIRRGINWAVNNGARVLSMSWGAAPSEAIIEAIEQARYRAHDGLGSVLVAAAGNDGGPVSFPATLDSVTAVSGVNNFDEFKTFTSRDNETWWASSYGPEIDLSAPCVGLLSTDVRGTGGFASGNYVDGFNGTSAAAPLVAAAAGLLLSARQSSSAGTIIRSLQDSAVKVGSAPFVDGRNQQVGFGRIDVLSALAALQRTGRAAEADDDARDIVLPAAEEEDGMVSGVLRIAASPQGVPAYFLLPADGEPLLLKSVARDAVGSVSDLETRNAATWHGQIGTQVRIAYRDRQHTPYGGILWSARPLASDEGGRLRSVGSDLDGEVPPNEIWLGTTASPTGDGAEGGRAGGVPTGDIPPEEVRLGDPRRDIFAGV